MKLKAAITEGTPKNVIEALGSARFAEQFFKNIACDILGISKPEERPAEVYVQKPDITVCVINSLHGIEMRLTGVSRGNRSSDKFHKALKELHKITKTAIRDTLYPSGKIQLFCVIMLDGDIETSPDSGKYSNTLESEAEWIEGLSQ